MYFRRGDAGTPLFMNLHQDRFEAAGTLLMEMLSEAEMTYQQLVRNAEPAKQIRKALLDQFKITKKDLVKLLDKLANEKKIEYEEKGRGKGKIMVTNRKSQDCK
jgi:hypothetical protein